MNLDFLWIFIFPLVGMLLAFGVYFLFRLFANVWDAITGGF